MIGRGSATNITESTVSSWELIAAIILPLHFNTATRVLVLSSINGREALGGHSQTAFLCCSF